jgi:ectoine utilization protein EutC
MIAILTESELRKCLTLDLDVVRVVEEGFAHLVRGEAHVPPIMIIEVPGRRGEIDIKSAYIEGLDTFAVKIASGFQANSQEQLPTSSGMMILLSAVTGFPQALLLDNGYLTDLRTAAAGAIAAKYLARKSIDTVGVLGSGAQARYQVRALRLVRDFKKVKVWARRTDAAERYVDDMSRELGCVVEPVADPHDAVSGSDIVITSTAARQPLVDAEWVHPGLHITAMGSDGPDKRELDPKVLAQADLFVCDLKSQSETLGELHHALDSGVVGRDRNVIELGELVTGSRPGRTDDRQVTVCDLTGVGVQDTVIARLAHQHAIERGLGTKITNA